MNSASQHADLASVEEAAAYAVHPELRQGLLSAFRAASSAFATAEAEEAGRPTARQAPWLVLDRYFGRRVDGTWVGGPVDAFKLWSSATLFSALAYRAHDDELRRAALAVLSHYTGDMVYTAGGRGTAGFVENEAARRNVLRGADAATLALLPGGVDWAAVVCDEGDGR